MSSHIACGRPAADRIIDPTSHDDQSDVACLDLGGEVERASGSEPHTGLVAVVPESLIEALRTAEDAEDAAEADAAMDEPGESVPWEQVKAELGL